MRRALVRDEAGQVIGKVDIVLVGGELEEGVVHGVERVERRCAGALEGRLEAVLTDRASLGGRCAEHEGLTVGAKAKSASGLDGPDGSLSPRGIGYASRGVLLM